MCACQPCGPIRAGTTRQSYNEQHDTPSSIRLWNQDASAGSASGGGAARVVSGRFSNSAQALHTRMRVAFRNETPTSRFLPSDEGELGEHTFRVAVRHLIDAPQAAD